MSEIRYRKITLVDGTRLILRITRESPHFITGLIVDADGEEIVPRGVNPEGKRYHQTQQTVQRTSIKKAVEMRMNNKYATLEVVPLKSLNHSTIKTAAQLDAEIAEALRAKKWQEQVAREDRDRRARIATPGPSPEQLYDERVADVAAGVFHGERRGRAQSFRKVATAAEALKASEAAKRWSDDVHDAAEHRAAAEAHRRAAKLHKSDPAGTDAAWLHDRAASNHQQAAAARASRALKTTDPARTPKTFAAFQEKLSAANEHTAMAQEYARQAIAAARMRV